MASASRTIDLLSIEITSHCNFCCTFCPDGQMKRPRGHMDPALFERVVAELASKRDRLPVRQVQLNLMGEPFVNPRIFDLIRIANRHGVRPVVVTNGSLLTPERSREILGLDLEYLQLSYQTPTRELFELRKAKKGDFEEYRARVLNFLEMKFACGSPLAVWVHMLDNSKRFLKDHQLVEGVVREEQERFFAGFSRSLSQRHRLPAARGKLDEHTSEILPGVQLHFRDCMDWGHAIRPPGTAVLPSDRGICPLPGFQLAVLWNGDTTICCLDYDGRTNLGNVQHSSLETIWSGERVRAIQDDIARGVLTEKLCQDCRGTLYEIETGRFIPNSERPWLSKALDFVRSYGVRKAMVRGLLEIRQRLRRPPPASR